ncbi:MAG TPA: CsbD family protein [Blastocatellia bacterium]|nr:CsbD family protein [Blastocatellia bacterium]
MAIPNKDEIKGKFRETKGDVKEKIGRATNDPELIEEGQSEETAGRTQETFGKARRKVGDAIKNVGDAIRK